MNFYSDFGGVTTIDSVGGGAVIQVTHDLGNGFSVSGALEDLDSKVSVLNPADDGSLAIGVVAYSGEGISAHVSLAAVDILDVMSLVT